MNKLQRKYNTAHNRTSSRPYREIYAEELKKLTDKMDARDRYLLKADEIMKAGGTLPPRHYEPWSNWVQKENRRLWREDKHALRRIKYTASKNARAVVMATIKHG